MKTRSKQRVTKCDQRVVGSSPMTGRTVVRTVLLSVVEVVFVEQCKCFIY